MRRRLFVEAGGSRSVVLEDELAQVEMERGEFLPRSLAERDDLLDGFRPDRVAVVARKPSWRAKVTYGRGRGRSASSGLDLEDPLKLAESMTPTDTKSSSCYWCGKRF